MRIGIGYDAHRLTPGETLYLGGVLIPYEKGLSGVSDADVLLHAIMDALLGAAAMGDIGVHFPPSDKSYKGIRSTELLKRTLDIISDYKIINIDSVITAQEPHLSGYIYEMRQTVAAICGLPEDCVSIKATTTERMGFEGRGEGISAQAVCIIEKNNF